MRGKSGNWVILAFLFTSIPVGFAQICGNPIGATQKGVLTMSLNGTYQHVSDPVQNIISKRIFFKTQWGLGPKLDIYGLLGNVQLGMSRINAPSTITDYKDKYRFSYGVGFASTLGGFSLSSSPPRSKVRARQRKPSPPANLARVFAGGHVIWYPSESSYEETREILNYTVTHQYAMKYDIMEATGYAGISIPYRVFRLYFGGIGWGIDRKERKTEYLVGIGNGDESIELGKEKGRYRSGIWTGSLVGIQWNLPQQYSITVEAIGFNSQNYQIMIGISQSGWQ